MEDFAPRTGMERLFRGPDLIARINLWALKTFGSIIFYICGAFDRDFPKRKLHHQRPTPVRCSIAIPGLFGEVISLQAKFAPFISTGLVSCGLYTVQFLFTCFLSSPAIDNDFHRHAGRRSRWRCDTHTYPPPAAL